MISSLLCGAFPARAQKAGTDQECGESRANPGDPIAVECVEGSAVDEVELREQSSADMTRHLVNHASVRINRSCYTGVCGPQNPAIVFDGTHSHHVEVLPRRAGVSVPAIVTQVHQDLGPPAYKLANFVSEDGFVADKDPIFSATVAE